MNGNQLFIYKLLLDNDRELTLEQIWRLITYGDRRNPIRTPMGERTLKETLRELTKEGYITCTKGIARKGEVNRYCVLKNKVRIVNNNNFVTLAVIWRILDTESFRLYHYLCNMIEDKKLDRASFTIDNNYIMSLMDMELEEIELLLEKLEKTHILEHRGNSYNIKW